MSQHLKAPVIETDNLQYPCGGRREPVPGNCALVFMRVCTKKIFTPNGNGWCVSTIPAPRVESQIIKNTKLSHSLPDFFFIIIVIGDRGCGN